MSQNNTTPGSTPPGSVLQAPGLDFQAAAGRLKKVVTRTPLTYNHNLSRNSKAYGKPMTKPRGDIEIGVPAPIESLQIRVRVDKRAAE